MKEAFDQEMHPLRKYKLSDIFPKLMCKSDNHDHKEEKGKEGDILLS